MSQPDLSDETRTADEIAAARAARERKSTAELFTETLAGDYDDDVPWEAVHILRLRGTLEVFETAKKYCLSEDPKARARGLGVLAQLGSGKPDEERPFMAESVSIAIKHLADSGPEVASSAAWALSHLGTELAVESLISLRKHPDPSVRHAVACCSNLRRHPEGVPILIALMEDENEEVRDWAAFALGGYEASNDGVWSCPDSPEIRATLRRRVDDTCENVRREAIWGLARRKDPLGLKLLLAHLESESWWSGDIDVTEDVLCVKRGAPVEELCQGLRQLLTSLGQEIAKP